MITKFSKKQLLNNTVLWYVIPSVVAFVGFYIMIPNTITGFHLSDLFLTMSSQKGLMPSPGYAVYSFILHIFIQLFGSVFGVAASGHLLSALFSSLALGAIYISCLALYQKYNRSERSALITQNFAPHTLAILITSIVGSSRLFWRYSLFTERFSFSLLLVSLSILLTIKLLTNKKHLNTLVFLLSLCLGIGIGHQWIFVPIALVLFWQVNQVTTQLSLKDKIQSLCLFVGAALIPQLLLFGYFDNHVIYAARLQPNFQGLVDYFFRFYLGDGTARSTDINNLLQTADLETIISGMWTVVKTVGQSFSYFPYIFLLAGVFFHNPSKARNPQQLLTFLLILLTFLLGFVFNWSNDLSLLPELVAQTVVLAPIVGLLSWFGLYELLTRLQAFISTLFNSRLSQAVLGLIIIGIPILVIFRGIPEVSLNNKLVNQELAIEVLAQAENNSLVTCFSFSSCYSLIYHQQINKVNTEAIIVPFYYLPGLIEFPHVDLQKFPYAQYPMVIYDIITSNRYQRPIYAVDMFDEYFKLLGIDFGFINYVTYGNFSQLTNSIPDTLPATKNGLTEKLLSTTIASWDQAVSKVAFEMIKRHVFNASVYMKASQRQLSVVQANLATNLGYKLDPQIADEISQLRTSIESIPPNKYHQLGSKPDTIAFVLDEVEKLEEAGLLLRATQIAQGAVTLDATNVSARLRWASLLEKTEASSSAVEEYTNILLIDPNNQTAQERLEYQAEISAL